MTTPSDSQKVVEEYLEAYNDRAIDRIEAVLADEIESESSTISREDLVGAIETYWAAFPDCHHNVDRYVTDGDHVSVRTTFAGTHKHEYYGHAPTDAEFEVTEFMLFHVDGSEIDEYWYAWDELGFWEQLGVLDHPLK